MEPKPLYEPSLWGQEYHNLTVNEALGAGAAGPGKSLVLLCDPIPLIKFEHNRCMDKADPLYHPWEMSQAKVLHLRRTRNMLDETLDRANRILKSLDPGVKYTGAGSSAQSPTTFIFSSGLKYQFAHCKDPGDWQLYMSNQFTQIAFDELVQFEWPQYENISRRCRPSEEPLRAFCKIRSMSNPMQKGDNSERISVSNPEWVRKRFVDPAPEGRKIIRQILDMNDGTKEEWTKIYLPATLYDNPDKEFVRYYEKTLRSSSKYIQQALLYGNWYAQAGSYYGNDWEPSLHVCSPFGIPKTWKRFRSMDWGFKQPGCVIWFAMDDEGNLYAEREYTFQGKSVQEVAENIKQIEDGMGLWRGRKSLLTGPADDQLWEERGDGGKTKALTMKEMGISWVKANKKSRAANGIRLLNRIRDHQDKTTTPGIVFFDTCRMCIRTIPAIGTEKNFPECPADGGEDHHHDAVLYACAYASYGKRGIRSVNYAEDSEINEDESSVGGYY